MASLMLMIFACITLTSAMTTIDNHCPSLCTCKTVESGDGPRLHLTCYLLGLEDFDARAFSDINVPFSLTVSCDSGVPNEPTNRVFMTLKNLRALKLNKCKLRYIHQSAFEGLPNLTDLWIESASNLYLQIHPLALEPLQSLTNLALIDNGLTKVWALYWTSVQGFRKDHQRQYQSQRQRNTSISDVKLVSTGKTKNHIIAPALKSPVRKI